MLRISSYVIGLFPIKMNHLLYRHIAQEFDKFSSKIGVLFIFKN